MAETEGHTHIVGLAHERAGVLCLADEQRRLAGWYLASARAAYEKWGATAKVAWLDREYTGLLPAADNVSKEADGRPVSHQGESFDLAAALQASRIIASGESPDRVLTHLMQVIRLQAGAETAHLLILERGKPRLEASATAHGDVVLFTSSSTDQASFSPAIVNYVLHSGEDLMLAEANPTAALLNVRISRAATPNPCFAVASAIGASCWDLFILSTARLPAPLAGRNWSGCASWRPR